MTDRLKLVECHSKVQNIVLGRKKGGAESCTDLGKRSRNAALIFWNEITTEKKFEEGHCPKCGAERADVVAQHTEQYNDGDIIGATDYSVLECRGCGHHYFKTLSWNSEDLDHEHNPITGEWEPIAHERIAFWPPVAKRRRPEWADDIVFVDRVLGSLFDDVYTALSNNLGVLAAIGMRTVFDRA